MLRDRSGDQESAPARALPGAFSYLILRRPLSDTRDYSHLLCGVTRLREVKLLAQGNIAFKWQRQGWNPGSLSLFSH